MQPAPQWLSRSVCFGLRTLLDSLCTVSAPTILLLLSAMLCSAKCFTYRAASSGIDLAIRITDCISMSRTAAAVSGVRTISDLDLVRLGHVAGVINRANMMTKVLSGAELCFERKLGRGPFQMREHAKPRGAFAPQNHLKNQINPSSKKQEGT